jgi:hypothetical protein
MVRGQCAKLVDFSTGLRARAVNRSDSKKRGGDEHGAARCSECHVHLTNSGIDAAPRPSTKIKYRGDRKVLRRSSLLKERCLAQNNLEPGPDGSVTARNLTQRAIKMHVPADSANEPLLTLSNAEADDTLVLYQRRGRSAKRSGFWS